MPLAVKYPPSTLLIAVNGNANASIRSIGAVQAFPSLFRLIISANVKRITPTVQPQPMAQSIKRSVERSEADSTVILMLASRIPAQEKVTASE